MLAPACDGLHAFGHEFRTAVDKAGIELDETCTSLHLYDGVVTRHDTARSDHGELALEVISNHGEAFGGASHQRTTGKTARLVPVGKSLNGGVIDCGVGGNDGVHLVFDDDVNGAQDGVIFKVGSKLHGDGLVGSSFRFDDTVAFVAQSAEQFAQRGFGLQRAQVLCVRTRNVDCNVVGTIVGLCQTNAEVADCVFNGGHSVLADVDAQYTAAQVEGVGALEVAQNLFTADVVKAHAVDDAFGRNDSEAAGLGIAGLSHGRNGADFDVTEAKRTESAHAFAILVHASRQTDGVREANAHDFNGIFGRRVSKKLVQAERGDPIKIGHDDMVSGLGLHLKEDAFGEFV